MTVVPVLAAPITRISSPDTWSILHSRYCILIVDPIFTAKSILFHKATTEQKRGAAHKIDVLVVIAEFFFFS